MQSAIMTESCSQGFEWSKIARQTNVVKCCHCESSYSRQNFQFYYCCQPFKLDKLFCHACKDKKFACLNCRNKQQTIVIQPKNLGKLDEEYFKKAKNKVQVNKVNDSKADTITINSQHDQCFNCNRNFIDEKIQSYCHRSCDQKMCFPCLFEVFHQQNEMFSKDSVIKKNYQMLMSCCETEGQKLIDIQNLFKDEVCVFCGAHDQATQQWFIKIQKKICFCNQCYLKQLESNSSIASVVNVLDFIVKNSPKNCNYCEQPLKLHEDMKHEIIYFNKKLCRKCSIYLPQKQQQTSQLLIKYLPQKASKIETGIKQLQTTECSQCMQRVVFLQSSKKEQKPRKKRRIQFDLIKWKNQKYYCSICLYFKYEKLRKQFENKRSKIMPVAAEQQIDRLSLFKIIYQNHFTQRCMICSNQEQQKQSFIILNKKTKPLEWDNLQLACRFCKKCAKFLIQKPERYNRLKNIKLQMEKRDPNFLDQFQQEQQFKTYQSDNKPQNVTENIQSDANQKPQTLTSFWQFTNGVKQNNNNQQQLQQRQTDKKNSGTDQYPWLNKQKYIPKHYEEIRFSQLDFDQLQQFKSISDEEHQKEKQKWIDGEISFEQNISRYEGRLRQEKQRQQKENFKEKLEVLLTSKEFVKSVINALQSDNQNCSKQLQEKQNSSRLPNISQQQNISVRSPTKHTIPTPSLTKDPTNINTTTPSNPCKITECHQSTCQQLMFGLMCQDCFVRYLLFGKDLREEVGSKEFDRWKEERECLKKEILEI